MPHAYPLTWQEVWVEGTGMHYSAAQWMDMIGVSPLVVATIWAEIPEHAREAAGVKPVHLLWLLNWFKKYDTVLGAHVPWHVSDKTFRVHVDQMLFLVYDHVHFIRMADRFEFIWENVAFLAIDATLCPVAVNRRDWDAQYPFFSVHHGCHGLKYEIAVHWLTGRLHWVAGGVCGGVADSTLTRFSTFLHRLLPGEYALADGGYPGIPELLIPFPWKDPNLTQDQGHWNKLMNPHRTIVENAFARFSKFKILCVPYRGKLDKHPYIFAVIAQIVQADIAFHPLRRDALELPSRHWWYDYRADAQSDPADFAQRLASFPLYVY